VFERTSIGRSIISAILHSHDVLTGIRLDIIFNGPSGMSTEFTINSNRVVLCLVENVDFVLVSKPHLLSVMFLKLKRGTYHLSRDTGITNSLE
jgi:hypothetical protein